MCVCCGALFHSLILYSSFNFLSTLRILLLTSLLLICCLRPTDLMTEEWWCSACESTVADELFVILSTMSFIFPRHSLLATQLVSEVNEELGLSLSISDMLRHSTLYSMARFINNQAVSSPNATLDLAAEVETHAQDNYPWVGLSPLLHNRLCQKAVFISHWSVECCRSLA